MAEQTLSLFLAGDAMIARPWSQIGTPAFLDLVAHMRAADATIVNLETVIHEFTDYAQAQSGGDWMTSPPAIAAELKWAGIDMLAHANNHAFDYGAGGILETLRHTEAADLVLSGSGVDLQAARAPRYLRCDGSTVAHVAMASTFVPYGRASRSRSDMTGRPGINPLALRHDTVLRTPPRLSRALQMLNGLLGREQPKRIFGIGVAASSRLRLERGRRPLRADARANLAAIREARASADIVVVSLHAHIHGPWLRRFTRRAIKAGAGVIVVHGPHQVRGLEIHGGCPVFYGLGDFVYEPDSVARFPQEMYDRLGLSDAAGPDDVRTMLSRSEPAARRETYEGVAAVLKLRAGRCAAIEFLPLDLQFDAEPDARGRPQLADPALGRRIIARVATRSAPYGTRVRYDKEGNRGLVDIGD